MSTDSKPTISSISDSINKHLVVGENTSLTKPLSIFPNKRAAVADVEPGDDTMDDFIASLEGVLPNKENELNSALGSTSENVEIDITDKETMLKNMLETYDNFFSPTVEKIGGYLKGNIVTSLNDFNTRFNQTRDAFGDTLLDKLDNCLCPWPNSENNETLEGYRFSLNSKEAVEVYFHPDAEEGHLILLRIYTMGIDDLGQKTILVMLNITLNLDPRYNPQHKEAEYACELTYINGPEGLDTIILKGASRRYVR